MKNKSVFTEILYIHELNIQTKSMNTGKEQLETN